MLEGFKQAVARLVEVVVVKEQAATIAVEELATAVMVEAKATVKPVEDI